MTEVFVVTSKLLGWDCIVGVFNCDDVSKAQLEAKFSSEEGYIIHYVSDVHKDLHDFQEYEDD